MLSSLYTDFFFKQGTLINMLDLKESSPTESVLFIASKTGLDLFSYFICYFSVCHFLCVLK